MRALLLVTLALGAAGPGLAFVPPHRAAAAGGARRGAPRPPRPAAPAHPAHRAPLASRPADLIRRRDAVEGLREVFRQTLPFQGILIAIATNLIIRELRRRIEKPVIGAVASKVGEQLKPEIEPSAWAKLAVCIVLDLIGDASELVPVLGEATDIVWSGVDAALLKALFASDLVAAFGFAEEILPFTDIIPTFTLAWCVQELWPTTPLAKGLGLAPKEEEATTKEAAPAADEAMPMDGFVNAPKDARELLRDFDKKAKDKPKL